MTSSSSSTYSPAPSPWQDRLEEHCLKAQFGRPVFQIVSDRRGGRTAWSSIVTIEGRTLTARYWYDGRNLNNAREDAAECAIKWLTGRASFPQSHTFSNQPCQHLQHQYQHQHPHQNHGGVWSMNQSGSLESTLIERHHVGVPEP